MSEVLAQLEKKGGGSAKAFDLITEGNQSSNSWANKYISFNISEMVDYGYKKFSYSNVSGALYVRYAINDLSNWSTFNPPYELDFSALSYNSSTRIYFIIGTHDGSNVSYKFKLE